MKKKTNDRFLAEIFTVPPGEAGPHPDTDELADYAEDRLTGDAKAKLDYHLERCAECAEIVERLIEAETAPKPLPFPVFVPDFDAVRARRKAAEPAAGGEWHLAASEKKPLPEIVRVDDLLAGFQGEATGDGRNPSKTSTLRLAFTGPESPRPGEVPAGGVIVKWPTGQTEPHPFIFRDGRWRVKIPLPLPWGETVSLLEEKKIQIVPVR